MAVVALSILTLPVSARGWGPDGHEIVAAIAADNLTLAAQSRVAEILGVPAQKRAIERAMETVSVLPDTVYREEDRSTAPWHYIDICLQDRRADVAARCPGGDCVTGKIDEYSRRLKEARYDRWGAAGDLAFVIHFVADVHQPLHAANNEDRGGNCIEVQSNPPAKNLHEVWDVVLVRRLEYSLDSGRPGATAQKLEQIYAAERETDSWISPDDIAWESNQVARSEIYRALNIPIEPCQPAKDICLNPLGRPVELDSSYLDDAEAVAGHQLARAGFRLASLLNEIWTAPAGTAKADSFGPQNSSSHGDGGQIVFVGNRRSKIYAWPGCGTYDKMAPENRVVFASREAAEQAGYRAARNCR